MAAQLSCSHASHSDSTCNFSARFPGKNEFFPLSSCTKDIKSHLRQLKVAQTSVASEKDLILARVGLFNVEGNDMTVCPKHRAALGTWWRPIIKCYHPLHGNKRRKPERGASLQMCRCRYVFVFNFLVKLKYTPCYHLVSSQQGECATKAYKM